MQRTEMSIFEYISSAARCLAASKMRTFLTTLGIIVGISSVILINTIGNTLGKTIESSMTGIINGNELDITFFNYDDYTYSLGNNADEVADACDTVVGDSGSKLTFYYFGDYEVDSDYAVKKEDKKENSLPVVTLTGTTQNSKNTFAGEMIEGRYISDDDVSRSSSVAVISDYAAEKLFGTVYGNMGKTVDIKDVASFTVVGVYKDKLSKANSAILSMMGEAELPTNLIVPYTFTEKIFGDQNDDILVYVLDLDADADKISEEIKEKLEAYCPEGHEVLVQAMSQQLNMINSVIGVITKVIAAIAAISLLVGGIGVMNIMLVSVTERTMEIGVRKAMGADNKSIRIQFITESVMISLLGSAIGIVLGLVSAKLLGLVAVKLAERTTLPINVDLSLPVGAIIVSVIFSFAVGLIFGVYPAQKAANMQVVDALRYE